MTMRLLEKRPRETARDYAVRVLRFNIVTLELKPGEMVSEKELSLEIGLSRTPVREALQDLGKTGIVEIFPQHGSMVSKIDFDRVEEARLARLVLEGAVARKVCGMAKEDDLNSLEDNLSLQRAYLERQDFSKMVVADNEFHRQIFIIARMMISYDILRDLSAHFERVRHLSMIEVDFAAVLRHNRDILDAIRARDADRAESSVRTHLASFQSDEKAVRDKFKEFVRE